MAEPTPARPELGYTPLHADFNFATVHFHLFPDKKDWRLREQWCNEGCPGARLSKDALGALQDTADAISEHIHGIEKLLLDVENEALSRELHLRLGWHARDMRIAMEPWQAVNAALSQEDAAA